MILRRTTLALTVLAAISACRSNPTLTTTPYSAATAGLAAEAWIIRDSNHALARALLAQAAEFPPPDLDPDEVERWRASGLRILRIPMRSIPSLRSTLPPGGPAELRNLGQIPLWTPLFQGPDLSDPIIRLDSGLAELPPGRPMLLVRSWIEPAMEDSQAPVGKVRIEIVPQHADLKPMRDPIGVFPSVQTPAAQQGQIFDRLLVSFVAEAAMAYVIVGEPPEVDWSALVPEAADPADESAGDDEVGGGDEEVGEDDEPDDRVPFPRAGPSNRPTLGEAMLSGTSYARGTSLVRVVLVLIPNGTPSHWLLAN